MTPAIAARAPASRQRALNLGAYAAFARLGARQEIDARAALIARAGFLCIILFVFSRLWQVVIGTGALAGREPSDFLWYLAVTELVILSFPYLHIEIGNDIRNGELVVRLPLPVSYPAARFAEGLGGAAVRFVAFAPVVVVAPAVLAGGWPAPPAGLATGIPLAGVAIVLALLVNLSIGLTAVWLHNAEPISWIWQKLSFLFGGVILPLEIYPDWLRSIALWTPFAALANGPGRMVLEASPGGALVVIGAIAGWSAAAALLAAWLWRAAERTLDAHGS